MYPRYGLEAYCSLSALLVAIRTLAKPFRSVPCFFSLVFILPAPEFLGGRVFLTVFQVLGSASAERRIRGYHLLAAARANQ